jgi:hypothetical protein
MWTICSDIWDVSNTGTRGLTRENGRKKKRQGAATGRAKEQEMFEKKERNKSERELKRKMVGVFQAPTLPMPPRDSFRPPNQQHPNRRRAFPPDAQKRKSGTKEVHL